MNAERRGELAAHYSQLAPKFVQHWSYSEQFVSWMTGRLRQHMALTDSCRLLDVGSGPALYTRRLTGETNEPAVCLDPSPELLAQIPANPALIDAEGTAEDLARGAVSLPWEQFDVILLKESLHHVPSARRHDVLRHLAERLTPTGRLVVVMLPTTLGHPLFEDALRRFAAATFTPERVAAMLADSGLDVATWHEQFEVTMPTRRWLTMVADRYMTLLRQYSDDELADGIAEIRRRHLDDRVSFQDHYVFIVATASGPIDNRSSE